MNVVEFARSLVDIDSTTGHEAKAGAWLSSALRRLHYQVVEQPVGDGRYNIFARLGSPVVVLSTHYDCVPPFFPSSVRDGRLYGRGSCDAKGIIAAQVAAVERLRAAGERRVGLLFVVGEERGSDGAAVANTHPPGSKFLINGEPTDSRLATFTRGVLRLRLRAAGIAAHSALPERGESAIDKLLDALVQLRGIELPSDPQFGQTFFTIGLIEGGVAPNVISPQASAEVLFRTIGPPDDILARLHVLEPLVSIEEILRVPEQRLETPEGTGIESAPCRFTTDLPLLDRWGAPMLFGPGSILVAHTSEEHIDISELEAAPDTYARLAVACLRQ